MPAVDADSGTIAGASERAFSAVRNGYTAFAENDIIVAKITPCMENGKAAIARNLTNGVAFGSTEFHVLRPSDAVLPEYVFHFIRQESFRNAAAAEMSGNVGQQRVPASFLAGCPFPLPPAAEQHRIVARLEALFTELATTRSRLARIPILMKRLRQSVLAAACSGRFTEDWRRNAQFATDDDAFVAEIARLRLELHDRGNSQSVLPRRRYVDPTAISQPGELPEIPDSWRWVSLDTLCARIADVDHKMPRPTPGGIPYISTKDFRGRDEIDFENAKHISRADFGALCRKIRPQQGDILLSRYGTVGEVRPVVTNREFQASYSIAILKVLPIPPLTGFLTLALRSEPLQAQMQRDIKASSQPDLGLDYIKRFAIPLPPPVEQDEIVRRVIALFSRADVIEQRLAATTAHANSLTQSILAKAFRGELVPTEAALSRAEGRDYEPASVLIKRVRDQRPPTTGLRVRRNGRPS